MNPAFLVQAALDAAAQLDDIPGPPRLMHRERSRLFVEELAAAFRNAYRDRPDVTVLSKHYRANRARFGLNELLYDVLVCETDETDSAERDGRLTYVTHGLWAVESEFARNSREAMFDFNKLTLSAAERKLFVAPQVHRMLEFLRPLAAAASRCSGTVHVAGVPHPAEWQRGKPMRIQAWSWTGSEWQPADQGTGA